MEPDAQITSTAGATTTTQGGDTTTAAPGAPSKPATAELKLERFPCWDEHTGTAEQLVGAGLAKPGEFPGDPGRGRSMVTYDVARRQRGSPGYGTKAFTIGRVGKRFFVRVYVSEEETARRLEEARAKGAAERAAKEVAAAAEAAERRALAELAEHPKSKKEFAARGSDAFWSGYNVFYGAYSTPKTDSGYAFSAADRERFLALARQLAWEIRNARPRLDRAHRVRKLTAARAQAAKANMPLQRLLAQAIAMPPQPDVNWGSVEFQVGCRA